jgi:peptidoglycan hydrolase CwlO-like protein
VNDPIEQRVKTLELKVEFLENWKNTPLIQVTLPVILSMFLVASWANFAFASLDKRVEAIEKRFDKLEARMDKLENGMDKLESKMDKVLSELSFIKSEIKKT